MGQQYHAALLTYDNNKGTDTREENNNRHQYTKRAEQRHKGAGVAALLGGSKTRHSSRQLVPDLGDDDSLGLCRLLRMMQKRRTDFIYSTN